MLFNSGEPWEKFHEKIQEVTKEKATSFPLSYVWQDANVSLTEESWAAFIHYIDELSKDSAVIIEMKSSCSLVNNKIMYHFYSLLKRKVNSPLLRDQGLQHYDIRSRQLLFCCAYSAHVEDRKISITENYYFKLFIDSS